MKRFVSTGRKFSTSPLAWFLFSGLLALVIVRTDRYFNPPATTIRWEAPQGTPPVWLSIHRTRSQDTEQLRSKLHSLVDIDGQLVSIREALEEISAQTDIRLHFQVSKLKSDSDYTDQLDEKLINVRWQQIPVAEALEQVLSYTTWTWTCEPDGIRILLDANAPDVTRVYDLSWLTNDPILADEYISYIDQTSQLAYDCSESRIGSSLIVTCSEIEHFRLEAVLVELSRAQIPSENFAYGVETFSMGCSSGMFNTIESPQ